MHLSIVKQRRKIQREIKSLVKEDFFTEEQLDNLFLRKKITSKEINITDFAQRIERLAEQKDISKAHLAELKETMERIKFIADFDTRNSLSKS